MEYIRGILPFTSPAHQTAFCSQSQLALLEALIAFRYTRNLGLPFSTDKSLINDFSKTSPDIWILTNFYIQTQPELYNCLETKRSSSRVEIRRGWTNWSENKYKINRRSPSLILPRPTGQWLQERPAKIQRTGIKKDSHLLNYEGARSDSWLFHEEA